MILVRDYACVACSFLRSLRPALYSCLREKSDITPRTRLSWYQLGNGGRMPIENTG